MLQLCPLSSRNKIKGRNMRNMLALSVPGTRKMPPPDMRKRRPETENQFFRMPIPTNSAPSLRPGCFVHFRIRSRFAELLRTPRVRTHPGPRVHGQQQGVGVRLRPQLGRTWGRPRKPLLLKRGCERRHLAIRAPRYDARRNGTCCPRFLEH